MTEKKETSRCAKVAQSTASNWRTAQAYYVRAYRQVVDNHYIVDNAVVGKNVALYNSVSGMTPGTEGGTMNQCVCCGEAINPHDGAVECPMCSIASVVSARSAHDQYLGTTVEVQ